MGSDPLLEDVRRHVADLGFELVEFRKTGPPHRPVVQVRIDRPDSRPGHGVTALDCAQVSRALERLLEAPGGLGAGYALTVSSPGWERPVRFAEHWRRYAGRRVRVQSTELPGRPRVQILALADDAHVRVRLADGNEKVLALALIREALLEPEAS